MKKNMLGLVLSLFMLTSVNSLELTEVENKQPVTDVVVPVTNNEVVSNKKKSKAEIDKQRLAEYKAKIDAFTWADKKFSLGTGLLSGIGGVNTIFTMNIVYLNLWVLLQPHIHMSLIGTGLSSVCFYCGETEGVLPVMLNIGYNDYIKNFRWFIGGGGGYNISRPGLIVNAGAGVEWLIFKNYSLGFKAIFGVLYREGNYTGYRMTTLATLHLIAGLVF